MPKDHFDLPDTFAAELTIGTQRLKINVRFPSAVLPVYLMVPLLQQLTNQIVDTGIREIEDKGNEISCTKGCAACCCQLVPVSEPEAYYLLDLVSRFPKQRRTAVLQKYREIRNQLNGTDLWKRLHSRIAAGDSEERRAIGIEYFNLGLPCPFLEDNACSIHEHRPLSCREFLVISSPEYCAANDPNNVVVIQYPRRASTVLYRFHTDEIEKEARVVPLSMMYDWAEHNPVEEAPEVPAGQYLENFLRTLAAGAT